MFHCKGIPHLLLAGFQITDRVMGIKIYASHVLRRVSGEGSSFCFSCTIGLSLKLLIPLV